MLNTSIARDGRLAALSVEAEYLYLKTVPHLDRDGLIWGEPETLWATVCPRRPAMLARMAALLAEWLSVDNAGHDAPLVIAYATPEGTALYFPAFAKNQAGLRYEREPASTIPAPPGYARTAVGLVPQASGESPEDIRQPSGNLPADGWPEVEVEVKEEVERTPHASERARGTESAGRALAARMQQLNAEVACDLRQPIVEVLIDILGKRALAYPPGMPTKTLQERADALLDECHTIAKSLYLAGYKTDADVLALEEFWSKDWRGRDGGGTPQQFWAFVSERQGLAARNGRQRQTAAPPPAPIDGPAIPEAFPGLEVTQCS